MQSTFLLILVSFSEIFLVNVAASEVKLVATFNNRVLDTVTFSQTDNGIVNISISNLKLHGQYSMTIHKFPVKFIGPMSDVCQSEHVGDIFDPRNIMKERSVNYVSECKVNHSACAVGDLAGKFGTLGNGNDSNLLLSGSESIFGRSLVIQNAIGDITCAPIRSPSPLKTLVGVFRDISNGIAGTIVLRQLETNPNSETSVDIDLLLVDARSESKEISLAVHEDGSCSIIGPVFNPLAKTSCDKRQQSTCPIGDLSAKLGPIEVPLPGTGSSHSFYIDMNLPLSGKNSIVGRSLMISEDGWPLMCVTIQEYQVMEAEVIFNDIQGLSGIIGLKQDSMYEPVMVNVSVGENSAPINGIYEHLLSADSSCSISKVGNRSRWWNITGIAQSLDGLTLYGPKSAMFRKLVFNKTGSSKISCGTVAPKNPTYHLKAMANFTGIGRDAITGYVILEQVAFNLLKAFAYFSSMTIDLKYLANKTRKTHDHNWHIHLLPYHNNSKMQRCMTTEGHYNPYNVYVEGNKYTSTCDSNNAFRCELGDLSGKLGAYTIGSGMKQLTETENYLASWHNVIGRSVVIHAAKRGSGRITCANLVPQSDASYSHETLLLKNSSATRNKDNFQKVVSEALGIAAWRVADVKFHGVDGCLKYSFLLVDDTKSNLHNVFSNVVDDHPDKLKDFAPSCGSGHSNKWKINDGNAAEIVSVIFGIIALIVLIICIVFWLRKKHHDEEQKSKLVVAACGGNMGYSIEREETAIDTYPGEKNEKKETVDPVETYSNKENENGWYSCFSRLALILIAGFLMLFTDDMSGVVRTGSDKGWKLTTSL